MIYKKGRWTASYKDTFSLDTTLSPIIYAGLKRFHDVLEQKNREGKCLGIPSEYCREDNTELWDERELGADEEYVEVANIDVTDREVQNWLDDIKKMMYAFENKEPDMSLYNFKLNMVPVPGGVAKEGCSVPYTIECDNLQEKARYYADCDEHERLVQEGLNLFSKMYSSLWW